MTRPRLSTFIAISCCLALLWAIFWPRLRMLRMLSADAEALGAIQGLRAGIERYTKDHGRPPADLSEIALPELKLYCYDGDENLKVHRHGRISEVELRPAGGLEGFSASTFTYSGDEGKWLYDPRTGTLVLGCSGVDTKLRRPWYKH
ncbi:MAG: hypothetical protein PHV36_03150 [Elusimicrobiales bacterium]|nr:hypothetical protein [Elusimicrobiales bacterium]